MKLLISLLVFSSFAFSNDYLQCAKVISQKYHSSRSSTVELNKGSIEVVYWRYGSVSQQIEELATMLNLEVCTDVKYKILSRKVSYMLYGNSDNIKQFYNILNSSID